MLEPGCSIMNPDAYGASLPGRSNGYYVHSPEKGWTHGEQVDLYVRQLRDMKLLEDITTMTKREIDQYARWFAMALARAHARCGDPAQISGYMGNSDVFDQAIALFADAYADQTECDHAALVMAIKEGRIKAEVDV